MLASLLLLAPLAAHPNSVSSSRFVVEGGRVALAMRCQVLTLLEALPEIDRDDDGELEEAELQSARALLAEYVARHLTVAVDCGDTLASGRALTGRLESVALLRGPLRG